MLPHTHSVSGRNARLLTVPQALAHSEFDRHARDHARHRKFTTMPSGRIALYSRLSTVPIISHCDICTGTSMMIIPALTTTTVGEGSEESGQVFAERVAIPSAIEGMITHCSRGESPVPVRGSTGMSGA